MLAITVLLAGCQPAPRSASFFEDHPTEADAVLKACASAAHRGGECENAKAARAALERDRRIKAYRRGFE